MIVIFVFIGSLSKGHVALFYANKSDKWEVSTTELIYSFIYLFNYKGRDITNKQSQFTMQFGPA